MILIFIYDPNCELKGDYFIVLDKLIIMKTKTWKK